MNPLNHRSFVQLPLSTVALLRCATVGVMRFPTLVFVLAAAALHGAEKDGCIFCEIAVGRTAQASTVVYSDDLVVAFMDRAPRNPGHVLVIPKAHARDILDVPPATLCRLAEVTQRIAKAIKKTDLKAEGFNLTSNTGRAAGQDMFHLHFHVMPRFVGERPSPPGERRGIQTPAELAEAASKIRDGLQGLR